MGTQAPTNAVRHAGPGVRVDASLVYGEDAVTLSIVDDGRGAGALIASAEDGRGADTAAGARPLGGGAQERQACPGREAVLVIGAGRQACPGHGTVTP